MLTPYLLLFIGQRTAIGTHVPRPLPYHRDWGPAPPVAPYGEAALPPQVVRLPLIFPVLGPCHYENGYGQERGGFKHTGIDIVAAKMTPIVAPFSGVIGLKRESFWIYGDSGWSMLGTHLNDDNFGKSDHKADRDLMFAPGLRPGQHVVQGQFIGYVGMSGKATAPHLHFEIYAPGRAKTQARIRGPYTSLKHAMVITRPVPTPLNPKDHPRPGEEKLEGCIRKLDPESMSVTLLLLHRQKAGEAARVVTYPSWRRVVLKPAQLYEMGGWHVLRSYPANHVFAFHAKANNEPFASVTRLGVDPAARNSFAKPILEASIGHNRSE